MTTLHQAASESVVFILLAVETAAAEEVDVSMSEVAAEDVEEEVDESEEDTSKELVEGAAVHMKMEFTYQMSPVTLKVHSGDAISNDTRKRITEDPVRTKFLENKKRRTTSSVSAGKDNKNRLISKIIAGVKNASRNES